MTAHRWFFFGSFRGSAPFRATSVFEKFQEAGELQSNDAGIQYSIELLQGTRHADDPTIASREPSNKWEPCLAPISRTKIATSEAKSVIVCLS